MSIPTARVRTEPVDLTRFAWLAIGAALLTIALKSVAWWVTGSVGLLSDAAESVVNLVAAIVALVALKVAIRPADKNHHFGHSKAEYFSAAAEGLMIFVAAAVILVSSIERFVNPRPWRTSGSDSRSPSWPRSSTGWWPWCSCAPVPVIGRSR